LEFKTSIKSTFNCPIERAFKTPMLCDISKIHTGFILSPKVEYTTEDGKWGQIGSTKKVHVAKCLTQSGGFLFIDKVLERKENNYWKIEVSEFQQWIFGFYKFVGEWETTRISKEETKVVYRYTMFANNPILYPLNYAFVNLFWRFYMKRVVSNVKKLAYSHEPYQFK
jgi:hypothetical protein